MPPLDQFEEGGVKNAQGQSQPVAADSDRLDIIRSAFVRGARTYGDLGSPLYAVLLAAGADDSEVVAMACHAQKGAQPAFHLLACVHFLLLGDPSASLARFYATLTNEPDPPEDAFPEFASYCRMHRDEILHLLATRTVQSTYVERCGFLLPLISAVAQQAGEPLNLIDIGCSAAVLLTVDKYAYTLPDGSTIGPPDAPLTIRCDMHGGPRPRIPAIAKRVGLDLHPIDVRSEDQRRWLMAVSLPELRLQREGLAKALDVVASTDIRLLEGNALDLISDVLAETPSPVCVYHSACLSYWPEQAKEALDARLKEVSCGRVVYRVGIEASAGSYAWHQGLAARGDQPQARASGMSELTIACYRGGEMESSIVARGPFFGPFEWIGSAPWK
jgi:hypothetical protein